MIKQFTLSNGIRVIHVPRTSEILTVHVTVGVGSNYETPAQAGISHFIEHMAFEGTKTRTSADIANSIERLGGEFSAYTSRELTCYYVKIIKKHSAIAFDILSDVLANSTFDQKSLDKERKVILSEIEMTMDNPRQYQWTLFNRTLFKTFPAKNPIIGNRAVVSTLSSQDLVSYFKTHYLAGQMVITVVGTIPRMQETLEQHFSIVPRGALSVSFDEEKKNMHTTAVERRKINQSYAVLGYKTAKRSERDSYVLDVIDAITGRGLSGTLFRKIRVEHGMAYDVGTYHDPNIHYGTFACYFSTDKKNIPQCVDLARAELKRMQSVSERELQEAQQFIEGSFTIDQEDSVDFASDLGEWAFASKAEDAVSYVKKIQSVTLKDIKDVAARYFTDNYTFAVVEQE